MSKSIDSNGLRTTVSARLSISALGWGSMEIILVERPCSSLALNATFVAMVQMLVYAGAVMTLFLFVIMMIGVDKKEQSTDSIKGQTFLVSGVFLILVSLLAYVAVSSDFKWDLWFAPVEYSVEGTPQLIAGFLFTEWIFPFEIISILLIVATAAAIALAYDIKKRNSNA